MRLAIGLLLIGTSVGCAAAPTDSGAASLVIPRAAQLAGCYRVELGPWRGTLEHMGFVPFTEFRLDSAARPSSVARFHLSTAGAEVVRTALPEITGRRPGAGVWYPMSGDSLFVEWHNGYISGGYRVAVRRDSLVGLATTWTHWRPVPEGMRREDAIAPTAPARGSRVPCAG